MCKMLKGYRVKERLGTPCPDPTHTISFIIVKSQQLHKKHHSFQINIMLIQRTQYGVTMPLTMAPVYSGTPLIVFMLWILKKTPRSMTSYVMMSTLDAFPATIFFTLFYQLRYSYLFADNFAVMMFLDNGTKYQTIFQEHAYMRVSINLRQSFPALHTETNSYCSYLVFAISTGIDAMVVTSPLIMLAAKWHPILSSK